MRKCPHVVLVRAVADVALWGLCVVFLAFYLWKRFVRTNVCKGVDFYLDVFEYI